MLCTQKVILKLLLFLALAYSACPLLVKFRGADTKFNSAYFHNVSSYASNDTLYLDMYTIKPITLGMQLNIDIELRLSNSQKYQTLFTYEVDACRTKVGLRESLLKKWFKSLLKYGNFMENCPVGVGHYYLNDYRLEPMLVPSYLYAGDYGVNILAFYGKRNTNKYEMVLDLELEARID